MNKLLTPQRGLEPAGMIIMVAIAIVVVFAVGQVMQSSQNITARPQQQLDKALGK